MEQIEKEKSPRSPKKPSNIDWAGVGAQVGMTVLNAFAIGAASALTARAFSGATRNQMPKAEESVGTVVGLRKVGNA